MPYLVPCAWRLVILRVLNWVSKYGIFSLKQGIRPKEYKNKPAL